MGNLIKLSYWLNPLPGPWLPALLGVVYAVFALLVLMGIVAWWLAGKNKQNRLMMKFWLKVQRFSLVIGITGLLLIFFRQQNFYFLSMPVWFLLLVIGALVWAYYIVRYITQTVPQRKKEIEERKIKEKYLPR